MWTASEEYNIYGLKVLLLVASAVMVVMAVMLAQPQVRRVLIGTALTSLVPVVAVVVAVAAVAVAEPVELPVELVEMVAQAQQEWWIYSNRMDGVKI